MSMVKRVGDSTESGGSSSSSSGSTNPGTLQVCKKRRLGFHLPAKLHRNPILDGASLPVQSEEDELEPPDADEELDGEWSKNNNVEEFLCIDLEDEADEDLHYRDIQGDMTCEVCEKTFSVLKQFKVHHQRHSSLDHYQCPTCLRGFTTLKGCYLHELRAHRNKDDGAATTTDGKSPEEIVEEEEEEDEDEEEDSSSSRVIPSNVLCYRGPPVTHRTDAFDIEQKYGLRGRQRGELATQIQYYRNLLD